MKYHFKKSGSLIIVTMKLEHREKKVDVEVALDTGAVTTMINSSIAQYLGCDPGSSGQKRRVVTASGIEWCSVVRVDKVTACGMSEEKLFELIVWKVMQLKKTGSYGNNEVRIVQADVEEFSRLTNK